MNPTLVVITGPTAVGKTELCVDVAQHFNTQIISADSRQFFKELSIGTAKPSVTEMQGVTHHFINSHSVKDEYNVSHYEKDVLQLLEKLFLNHQMVILTGGSGLYIDAICQGFDDELPEEDKELRKQLNSLYNQHGIKILQEKLKQLDPVFYNEVDLNNAKRLSRAIEVCTLTNQPYSTLRKGIKKNRPFNIVKIGLERPREELFNRINLRVDQMIQQGLIDEVKEVEKYKHHNALKTVGYRELFDYLDNEYTLEDAIEKIKVNTRRYAKRQIAWFNREDDYQWFHPDEKNKIIEHINQHINI